MVTREQQVCDPDVALPTSAGQRSRVQGQKVVLREDEYVRALTSVIERNFYPDLVSIETALGKRSNADRQSTSARSVSACGSSHTTGRRRGRKRRKKRCEQGDDREWDTSESESADDLACAQEQGGQGVYSDCESHQQRRVVMKAAEGASSLADFHARFTSEDNDSFERLQVLDKAALEQHPVITQQRNMHEQYLGTLSEHTRTEPVGLIESVKRHVVRNALIFGPGAATEERAKEHAQAYPKQIVSGQQILLLDGNGEQQGKCRVGDIGAVGNEMFAQYSSASTSRHKSISLANTRFIAPLGHHALPVSKDSRGKVYSRHNRSLSSHQLVRTPGIEDITGGATPIMTWGTVGTPLLIHEEEQQVIGNNTDGSMEASIPGAVQADAPRFRVPQPTERQEIGIKLAQRAAIKGRKQSVQQSASQSTSVSSHRRSTPREELLQKAAGLSASAMRLLTGGRTPRLAGAASTEHGGSAARQFSRSRKGTHVRMQSGSHHDVVLRRRYSSALRHSASASTPHRW